MTEVYLYSNQHGFYIAEAHGLRYHHHGTWNRSMAFYVDGKEYLGYFTSRPIAEHYCKVWDLEVINVSKPLSSLNKLREQAFV